MDQLEIAAFLGRHTQRPLEWVTEQTVAIAKELRRARFLVEKDCNVGLGTDELNTLEVIQAVIRAHLGPKFKVEHQNDPRGPICTITHRDSEVSIKVG